MTPIAETEHELSQAADALTRYLLGCDADERERRLFVRAAQQAPLLTDAERRQWAFALRRPRWLPCLDAALARTAPHGAVRHRLVLMLAILETSPRHAHRFLPAPFGFGGMLALLLAGVGGVWRALLGAMVLRVGGLR